MDKKELIEHINNTLFDNLKDTLFTEPTLSITESAKDNKVTITFETEQGGVLVGGMLKKFEKVTIPQFVADWIKKCKSEKRRLHEALTYTPFGVNGWISNPKNQETFARAWLDGYEVEKEPKYTVRIKAVNQYLVRNTDEDFLGFLQSRLKSKFTRKELEDERLDWVFDCPGIEIEEVKG